MVGDKFSELDVRDLTVQVGKPRFELRSDLEFHSAGPLGTIWVPAGFQTDFASIPQIFWNILPPVGPYDRAAVVHDWLYLKNGCSRIQADQILKEGMINLGVSRIDTWLIYSGVRLGGWKPWSDYRKGTKNGQPVA